MHVSVDLKPVGPVSILPDIPSHRVSLLQGYNGIGKTLTVRLLQVLAGELPYESTSQAWLSMCRALGPGDITISDLSGTDSIFWRFDTRRWPDAGPRVQDDWFAQIQVNGADATLSDVRQRLQVHRLAGDETLLDSLALMVDKHRTQVQHLANELAAPGGRLLQAEHLVEEAVALLERVQPARLKSDRQRYRSDSVELEQLSREYEQSTQSLAALESATDTRNALDMLQLKAPELDARVRDLDTRLQESQRARLGLDEQLRLQTQRAAVSGAVQHQLDNARRTRDRNRDKLSRATGKLSAACASTNLPRDRKAIDQATVEARGELAELERRKEEADVVPALIEILQDLSAPLVFAADKGLSDRELLELHDQAVTVAELSNATAERHQDLERMPTAPDVVALESDILRQKRWLAQLAEMPDLMDEVERWERLYQQQEQRLQDLLSTGALEAAALARELEQQRSELDRDILRLAGERAGAVQQRANMGGGRTLEQLRIDLADQLEAAGIVGEELEPRLRSAASENRSMLDRINQLRETTATARQDITRQDAELREVLGALQLESNSWVLEGTAVPEAERATSWLEDLQARLSIVRDRLGRVRSQIQGVASSLESVAAELRGHEGSGTLYEDALRTWLSEEFSNWFDQPLLRMHLFPDSTDVRVNLATRQVTWRTPRKSESRPLSAFSSGEQAFAYTQARLARLDAGVSPDINRLIVLDEFGSFIAEDRLHDLFRLLKDRIASKPRDHVVIVLPLREDFRELAEEAFGSRKDQLNLLAESLDSRQYIVQDLSL